MYKRQPSDSTALKIWKVKMLTSCVTPFVEKTSGARHKVCNLDQSNRAVTKPDAAYLSMADTCQRSERHQAGRKLSGSEKRLKILDVI